MATKQHHTHQINNLYFIIEEDCPGEWFWSNDWDSSEQNFPTQADALADAMEWVRKREAEKNQKDIEWNEFCAKRTIIGGREWA